RLRTLADDVLIGFVAIHGIEWNNRSGQLAIGIGNTDYRGKGFGAEAVGLILRYAFYELNLNRVGLDVIEYNTQAIRTYEKAGFQLEGRVRSAVLRDGNSYDRIMMGILYSEWRSTVQV
ncbi:GNAT family N-acetyltransferase, partial [Paenibacillus sp. OT2-17]